MTITFLQPDGVELSATRFRQGQAATHGGGANRPLGGRSGFRVDTAADVFTATSTTWTLKPCSAMIDPGALTHQGMYGWVNDANYTGSMDAADATLTRHDRVWIMVNDSTAGDGSGAVSAWPQYQPGSPTDGSAIAVPPRAFLVADITVPPAGGGSPTVQLNPARYAAAGASLPVKDAAARDALVKYDTLEVVRKDLPGRPTEITDGTSWFRQAVTSSAVPVNDGFWTMYGGFTKTVHENVTQVTASLQLVRTGVGFNVTVAGNALIVGLIPAGFRPPGNFSLVGSILTAADARYAEPQLIVNNGGSLVGRSTSGGDITISTGSKLFVTGTWYV